MGREIRRVPSNWIHPKRNGNFIPLFDEDYQTALANWEEEKAQFDSDGNVAERERIFREYGVQTFEEWDGGPPHPNSYRPKFHREASHYQIYETVSEGTPMSPVFVSLDDMKMWLLSKGYSEHAASIFVEDGWAPSMVFTPGRGVSGIGIHSLDHMPAD